MALSIPCFTVFLAQAQLVFITQADMRTWYNDQAPGSVDANGYLNTQHPGLALITDTWLSTGTITMVEGLAYLPNLVTLDLYNSTCTPFTVDGWPPNIERLWLDECTVANIPSLPAGLLSLETFGPFASFPVPLPSGLLELTMMFNPSLTTFPVLPPSLTALNLEDVSGPVDLSVLPPGLVRLRLSYVPDLTVLGSLPATLTELELNSVPGLATVPVCPMGVRVLSVPHWAVDQWGGLPDSLRTLFISQSWQTEFNNGLPYPGYCIPHLPDQLETFYLSVYPDMALLPVCLPNTPSTLVQAVYFYFIGACLQVELPIQACAGPNPQCPSTSTMLKGLTFNDLNGDGLMNGAEPIAPGATVNVEPGGLLTASDQSGLFIALPGVGSFTVTRAAQPYWTVTTPPQTSALLFYGDTDSLDAIGAVAIPGMYDLRAQVACSQSSPGFLTTCWCHVHNVGTEAQTASLSLSLDSDQSFASFVIPPDNVVGNDAVWSVPSVQPGETWSVMLSTATGTTVSLGTDVEHTVSVSPEFADLTIADNTATWNDVVVGSYDPNDKMVRPTVLNWAEVAAGTPVEYTIRFQNTGTAPAHTVIISDSLSADLQWDSFEMLSSSHAHIWWVQNGVVYFRFDNIMLPDSNSNEPASHGFVKFRMQPRTDLMPGASVANRARIYFDYNGAITTNQAVFEVATSTGLGENEDAVLAVWPNPATDRVHVTGAVDGTVLQLFDVTGRVVLKEVAQGGGTVIDIGDLSGGLYMVRPVTGTARSASFVKR